MEEEIQKSLNTALSLIDVSEEIFKHTEIIELSVDEIDDVNFFNDIVKDLSKITNKIKIEKSK